jgi:hypothetical protein
VKKQNIPLTARTRRLHQGQFNLVRDGAPSPIGNKNPHTVFWEALFLRRKSKNKTQQGVAIQKMGKNMSGVKFKIRANLVRWCRVLF